MSLVTAPSVSVRNRNFFLMLKLGESKKRQLHKALAFAQELIPLRMRSKVMQKSIKLQHGFTTRQVRAIVRASRPKKHRERS